MKGHQGYLGSIHGYGSLEAQQKLVDKPTNFEHTSDHLPFCRRVLKRTKLQSSKLELGGLERSTAPFVILKIPTTCTHADPVIRPGSRVLHRILCPSEVVHTG